MSWEEDLEDRAMAGGAGDDDEPVVLFDDAVHGRQPEPGAVVFGREEGLEDVALCVFIDADAVVCDGKTHMVTGARAPVGGAVVVVDRGVGNTDGDHSGGGGGGDGGGAGRDGVAGVDHQVGEDLIEL